MAPNDFAIEIQSKYSKLNGDISSEDMLDAAQWRVDVSLSPDGKISGDYYYYKKPKSSYFNLNVEWHEWMDIEATDKKRPPPIQNFGPISFKFYYIPRKKEVLSALKIKTSPAALKTFLDMNQGVRIYRDSFRVRPYGEPSGKGDWLDLGLRRVASPGGVGQDGDGWRVAPNQVLGSIEISRTTNTKLVDQTNREGIIEGEEYYEMRGFVLSLIEKFEDLARSQAKLEKEPDDVDVDNAEREQEQAVLNVEREVDSAEKILEKMGLDLLVPKKSISKKEVQLLKENISDVNRTIIELRKSNEETKRAYEKKFLRKENEKNTLSNLASLGILSVAFGHETLHYADMVLLKSTKLHDLYTRGEFDFNGDKGQTLNDLNSIADNSKAIHGFAAFYLAHIRPNKRRRSKTVLNNTLNAFMKAIEPTLNRMNIEVLVDFNELSNAKVVCYEIDMESVFVNLFSNAVWAMEKLGKEKRKIEILGKRISDSEIQVIFRDAGKGIPEVHLESIFTPMFSTRRDDKGNQIGTGMGLSITKNIIEDFIKVSINVNRKSDLGGAEFIITLPSSS